MADAPTPHTESVGNGDLDSTRRTVTFSPRPMRRFQHIRAIRGRTTVAPLLGALLALLASVSFLGAAAAPPAGATNWAPVHDTDFPDPSILPWNGMYYAFATQNFAAPNETLNIQGATSLNGINWTPWTANAVLPQVGPWAKAGNVWAPSVVRDNADNDFVMYYTA